uniref:Transmembrane protein n=1 Tax=Heterorhabditis bacteriophora TaxID=37862 RepID=A0A1I7X248_HETBA
MELTTKDTNNVQPHMNMDGMDHKMWMWFHSAIDDTVLFKFWTVKNAKGKYFINDILKCRVKLVLSVQFLLLYLRPSMYSSILKLISIAENLITMIYTCGCLPEYIEEGYLAFYVIKLVANAKRPELDDGKRLTVDRMLCVKNLKYSASNFKHGESIETKQFIRSTHLIIYCAYVQSRLRYGAAPSGSFGYSLHKSQKTEPAFHSLFFRAFLSR